MVRCSNSSPAPKYHTASHHTHYSRRLGQSSWAGRVRSITPAGSLTSAFRDMASKRPSREPRIDRDQSLRSFSSRSHVCAMPILYDTFAVILHAGRNQVTVATLDRFAQVHTLVVVDAGLAVHAVLLQIAKARPVPLHSSLPFRPPGGANR